jgi:putative ABC transport system permease protein
MAEYTDVFAGVAAYSPDNAMWDAPEGPRPLATEYVTSNYMSVLGLEPRIGRFFERAHDDPGAGLYAVLTDRAWRTMFGADPGIVGRSIRLNGQPVTVIGVGPEGFQGSGGALVTDVFLSISTTPIGGAFRVANLERRQDHWYQTWARLAPGVSLAQATAAMNALATRLAEDFPDFNEGRGITVFEAGDVRVHPQSDGDLRAAGLILLVVVGLVLLLACSNLAGLLLVRGMSRQSEVAVRRALGASAGRVAGLMMTEALLLAVAGGAVGLLLARWIISIVPGLPLGFPSAIELSMDGRVLAFTVFLVVATGVLFGLAPALRSAGGDLAGTLRRDVRMAVHGGRAPLLRNVMVSVQVAISLVLLVGSALLVRSLVALSTTDAGVAAREIAFVGVNGGQAGLDAQQTASAIELVRERIAAIPGVRSTAVATRLPVQNRGGSTTTVVEGYEPAAGTNAVELLFARVSPGYFETMDIRLIAGRDFMEADLTSGVPITIVNESAAMRFWGTTDPSGRRIRPQDAPDGWIQVIGVVADSKVRTLAEPGTPLIYFPYGGAGAFTAYIVARAGGDATALVPAIRNAMREANTGLLTVGLGTLDSSISDNLASPRAAAFGLGAFSAIAMLLTGLGIYAILSFTVARRSAELGIRMALGAERRTVIGAVVGEVMLTMILGLAAGLGLAALAATRVEGLLFNVSGLDPASFGVAALLILVVAALAAFLPARRAVAIDPVEALRARP